MTAVLRFPFEKTVEPAPNDARLEFMIDCLDHLPPARQKRLILRGRADEIDFISDQQAQALLALFGLKEA